MKRIKLAGHPTTKDLKKEIQATLRQIVIKRDGGCILRHYKDDIVSQYRECGPFRNDGELILQAEHLHSRANASSFSDSRLVVCLCQKHHGYYKPQYSVQYYEIVRKHIGPACSALLDKVQHDFTPHKIDLKLELISLKQELKSY